jgi:hypothetical protein
LGLAGVGAFGVVHGFGLGGPPSERASTGVPVYTVLLSLYFAAVLAATRRGSAVQPRVLLRSAGLGLVAAALWAAAVPVLPPGIVWLGFLLVIAAGFGAALLARPIETGFVAGLVAVVIGAQVLVLAAAVMLHYGPDAWMAYAGPGPLTPQGQLEQNRAEAFDPYVGLAFLGALGAAALIGAAVTARLRERAETPAVLNA